jgi:hypothetical protein
MRQEELGMSGWKTLLLAIVWAVSLLITTTWARAQAQQWTPLAEPVVISANDMGFQIDWMNGRTPTGKLVIRLKGQWVEARVGEPGDRRVVPPPPPPPPPPPR